MSGKVSYFVDKKNRTVVCRLEGCQWIAVDRIEKYSNIDLHYGQYKLPDTFVGVARCHPIDNFDIEKGKKIALTRAKRARCLAVNHAIAKCIDETRRGLDKLWKYGIHEVPTL